MAWFSKSKSKKEQMQELRRRRRGEGSAPAASWLSTWQVLGVLLFLLMAAAVTGICFWGLSPTAQQGLNSRIRVRIVADFPFQYVSAQRTEAERILAQQKVGPSYRLGTEREERLREAVKWLLPELDAYQAAAATQTADELTAARARIAREFTEKFKLFMLDPADVEALTKPTNTPALRAQGFDEGLMTVKSILTQGIYNATDTNFTTGGRDTLLRVEVEGRRTPAPLLSQEDARRDLFIILSPLELDGAGKSALNRLLRQALEPNIFYDAERTRRNKEIARTAVQDVVIGVTPGEVLADPSSPAVDQERLDAYFQHLAQQDNASLGGATALVQKFLFVALLLAAAVIFVKSGLGQLEASPKLYALAAVLLLVNLVLLRLILGVGDSSLFEARRNLQMLLPWAAPTMLAPVLVTVLVGAAPATLVALLVSVLFAMMTGDTLEMFLVNFLASLVAIHLCRDVRVRAKLLRAGLLAGLAAAVCAAYLGFVNEAVSTRELVGLQMLVAAVTGLVTAIAAIGILPILENFFKVTTDITLLELTDFNHPLLRKLQFVAPGTYHHSLMVANLAERAAAEVGANALLCRACALYHDIGKMAKPEYFSENQREGYNPHEEVSPSMSALIIKSHIKEGLELARQYKLPQVVRDVIAQHHGTTLIKYFYHKARGQRQALTQPPIPRRAGGTVPPLAPPAPAAESAENSAADQSFFRYDGPKPNFKESAIVALADCLEAASRSLRKVTPQAVEELIESLVNDRIEDHQLDDSPITIEELRKITQSFNFTLLNMLHSRVQYPGGKDGATPPAAPAKEAAPAPALEGKTAPTRPPVPAAAAASTHTTSGLN